MRAAVVGATGRTGRRVVGELRRRGHSTLAVVRDPGRLRALPALERPDGVAEANVRDSEALAVAFADVDAVAFCVGAARGEPPAVLEVGIEATLGAMARVGARRLVVVSASAGYTDGDDPLSRYLAKPILRRALAKNNAATAAMDARVAASDLEWTIVRPPKLTEGRGRGRYRRRLDGNVRYGYTIRRADLAVAIVDALEEPSTARQVVSVAG